MLERTDLEGALRKIEEGNPCWKHKKLFLAICVNCFETVECVGPRCRGKCFCKKDG